MNKTVNEALAERENHESELKDQVKAQTEKLLKANNKLNKLSNTDPLTGLYNRRFITNKISGFHQSYMEQHIDYAVAMLDIDFFKNINDEYGHDCGDRVLCKLADTLSYYLDESSIISRWGGEEFVILIPNCGLKAAFTVVESLREKVHELTFKCTDANLKVSFSAGVASTESYSKVESNYLIHQADSALYLAKQNGRNQVIADSYKMN